MRVLNYDVVIQWQESPSREPLQMCGISVSHNPIFYRKYKRIERAV